MNKTIANVIPSPHFCRHFCKYIPSVVVELLLMKYETIYAEHLKLDVKFALVFPGFDGLE